MNTRQLTEAPSWGECNTVSMQLVISSVGCFAHVENVSNFAEEILLKEESAFFSFMFVIVLLVFNNCMRTTSTDLDKVSTMC